MAEDYHLFEEIAKHNNCATCHQHFEIAWKDGKYQLKCRCGYHEEPPAMERLLGYYEALKTGEPIDETIAKRMRNKMRIEREMKELKKELDKEKAEK